MPALAILSWHCLFNVMEASEWTPSSSAVCGQMLQWF